MKILFKGNQVKKGDKVMIEGSKVLVTDHIISAFPNLFTEKLPKYIRVKDVEGNATIFKVISKYQTPGGKYYEVLLDIDREETTSFPVANCTIANHRSFAQQQLIIEAGKRFPAGSEYYNAVPEYCDTVHMSSGEFSIGNVGNVFDAESRGCVFFKGKWAKEVQKPLFETMDGVDIFEGDDFWVVHIGPANGKIKLHTIPWTVVKYDASKGHVIDLTNTNIVRFSTHERAQLYIDDSALKYAAKTYPAGTKARNVCDKNHIETLSGDYRICEKRTQSVYCTKSHLYVAYDGKWAEVIATPTTQAADKPEPGLMLLDDNKMINTDDEFFYVLTGPYTGNDPTIIAPKYLWWKVLTSKAAIFKKVDMSNENIMRFSTEVKARLWLAANRPLRLEDMQRHGSMVLSQSPLGGLVAERGLPATKWQEAIESSRIPLVPVINSGYIQTSTINVVDICDSLCKATQASAIFADSLFSALAIGLIVRPNPRYISFTFNLKPEYSIMTEDGVRIYEGDQYCMVDPEKLELLCYGSMLTLVDDGIDFNPDVLVFSSLAAAEKWISDTWVDRTSDAINKAMARVIDQFQFNHSFSFPVKCPPIFICDACMTKV